MQRTTHLLSRCSTPPRSKARAGVSLMEVLISIAVILGGMLGVVSLFIVGGHEASDAVRKDRAAAVGRAARNEIQVRGWLDRSRWSCGATVSADHAVAIDPLGLFTDSTIGNFFPPQAKYQSGWDAPTDYRMRRVNIAAWASLADANAKLSLADQVFRSRDDLIFTLPAERTARATTENKSFGRYSWLATVCPVPVEAGERKKYEVSIVVFYERVVGDEFSCTVKINTDGTLLGGGDIVLEGADAATLRSGQWIMLCGKGGAVHRNLLLDYKWYRIVAIDDGATPSSRRVTLAGPDWQAFQHRPSASPPQGGWNDETQTFAAIFPQVVGVYTQTMELD